MAEIDLALVCSAQMVFRLDCAMFVEVSLALVGIELARYHILWLLVRYLTWQYKEALLVSFLDPIHH